MTEDTIEELLPQTEAPGLFLQAMEAENIHSPTGIELMTKVQQHYPDMAITVGLVTKQFYLGVPWPYPGRSKAKRRKALRHGR